MVLLIFLGIYIVVQLVHYKITGEWMLAGKVKPAKSDPETVNSMPLYSRKSDENIQIAYAYLAGWLIKKNSKDSKKKVDYVRLYFQRHFPAVHMSAMEKLIEALRNETNIRSVAKWILRHLPTGEDRIEIIDFLFEIIKADGDIIDREFVAIVRLAELIGVKASYIDKKMTEFQKEKFSRYNETKSGSFASDRRKAMLVLHLSEGFNQDQLKSSYRKLAVKYHPDKQFNSSPSEKEEANQKFIEIQNAYDLLCK